MEQSITFAQQLCQFNSFTAEGKHQAIEYVKNILQNQTDAVVEIYDKDTDAPYLIAKKICPNPTYQLLLEGHLDVVSAEGMKHPFDAVIENGILYARGCADMKGGCAAILSAFLYCCQNVDLCADLYLMFSTDEEYAGAQIQKALHLQQLPKVDFACIPEPTNCTLATAHKGEAWVDVEFFGKSAHSSMPHLGINAIYMATQFIEKVRAYAETLPQQTHILFGQPTLNIGTITGGSTPNVVPPYAKICIDIRYLPGQSIDTFLADLEQIATQCKQENDAFSAKITKIGEWYDVYTDRQNSDLLRLKQAAEQSLQHEIDFSVMTGWGEGGFIHQFGIPVVYFGPGDFHMAHTPGEQIAVADIEQMTLCYIDMIKEMCTLKRVQIEDIQKQKKILIVDGAMATELERMGCDIGDELWSAKILIQQPELIKKVHRSYFEAGADCGITASYQATIEGFLKKGYSEQEAENLIRLSVSLLREARDEWWQEEGKKQGRVYPLVCASVGPYGAYLADGSEYRGGYGLQKNQLKQFHKKRMELLWNAGADLFAVETIPELEEAYAVAELTQEMHAACWISFSCKNETQISDGTPIADCAKALESFDCVKAIGINCTAPQFVASLIRELKHNTTKPIIVYPNSGEEYDAVTKTWHGNKDGKTYTDFATEWIAAGATMIGGCCRTTPQNIQEIYTLTKNM